MISHSDREGYSENLVLVRVRMQISFMFGSLFLSLRAPSMIHHIAGSLIVALGAMCIVVLSH